MARVTITGIEKILNKVSLDRDDCNTIGAKISEFPSDKIDNQTSPNGKAFAKLAPSTLQRKKRKYGQGYSGKVLVETSALYKSFSHVVDQTATGWVIKVGSNMDYAVHHQYGSVKVKDRPPARPFMGFSEDDKNQIKALLLTIIRSKN